MTIKPDWVQARLNVLIRAGDADLGDGSSRRAVYELLCGLAAEVYRERLPSRPPGGAEPGDYALALRALDMAAPRPWVFVAANVEYSSYVTDAEHKVLPVVHGLDLPDSPMHDAGVAAFVRLVNGLASEGAAPPPPTTESECPACGGGGELPSGSMMPRPPGNPLPMDPCQFCEGTGTVTLGPCAKLIPTPCPEGCEPSGVPDEITGDRSCSAEVSNDIEDALAELRTEARP